MARLYFKTDFKEVYDKLEKMERAMQKKRGIMTEVGMHCRSQIRAKVPIDTGTLQFSIDYKLLDENTVEVGVMRNDMNPNKREQGTFTYGVYVEFGTRKMSSQSFMRSFWEGGMAEIQEMILNKILNLLKSA